MKKIEQNDPKEFGKVLRILDPKKFESYYKFKEKFCKVGKQ